MKLLKYSLVLLIAVGLVACAGKAKPPEWVIKGSGAFPGDRGKALYGVGLSEKSANLAMSRTKSSDRARQELAKILNSYVATFMKDFMEEHKDYTDPAAGGSDEFTSYVSKSVSEATLVGSQIVDRWEDEEGRQYALAILAVDDVLNQIGEKTKAALKEKKRGVLEGRSNDMLKSLDDQLGKKRDAEKAVTQ
jgi:hypothetical protein